MHKTRIDQASLYCTFRIVRSEIGILRVMAARGKAAIKVVSKERVTSCSEALLARSFGYSARAINEPEKGSNTGIYNISTELIARIQTLPKTSERIFGKASTDSLSNIWAAARKRLASNFSNPRLLKIRYHVIRHWKLTNYAHEIKDPFLVQMFARHKDMKSTSRYVHYEKIIYKESKQNEWTVRAAKTMDQASELMQVGFEYTGVEFDGFKMFRKRK